MAIKQVKLQSGRTGWQCKLQESYNYDFEQFDYYCEVYNIHARLGFKTPQDAWDKNPIIQGSTNPSDLVVAI